MREASIEPTSCFASSLSVRDLFRFPHWGFMKNQVVTEKAASAVLNCPRKLYSLIELPTRKSNHAPQVQSTRGRCFNQT